MKFGSVCSGIEAASVAWEPLGWKAAWLSEIEPFPCAVLRHHYPDVPNLGDMTTLPNRILAGEVEAPDLFCGGTPCQAFSVAGLRKSLDDARGNLSLTFCEIANAIDHIRLARGELPAIIFWENVPGVLSTKDNAFGCFLAGLVGDDEPAVHPQGKWKNSGVVVGPERLAVWRVLDAQYFGVAQRRRRVFVLSVSLRHPRAWPIAESLLPLSEGVRGDTAPRREAGEEITPTIRAGAPSSGPGHGARSGDSKDELIVPIAHTLRGEGFDASEDGTGRGTPLVPAYSMITANTGANGLGVNKEIAPTLDTAQPAAVAQPVNIYGGNKRQDRPEGGFYVRVGEDTSKTLDAASGLNPTCSQGGTAVMQPIGCLTPELPQRVRVHGTGGTSPTLSAEHGRGHGVPTVLASMAVRRLTPVEYERLQGFPDKYTNIPKKVITDYGIGPCVKQTVKATVLAPNGTHFVATNHCDTPQLTCARAGMPTGEGYELCKSVCNQRAHAEINAIKLAGKHAKGATLYVEGHTYACTSCTDAANAAGIVELIVGKEPFGTAADGPRYKALGNSWAVPVVRWIGQKMAAAVTN